MKVSTKHISPTLIFFCVFMACASSCTSYRTVQKDVTIDSTYLMNLQVDRRYKFMLKSGSTQVVKLVEVKDGRVMGYLMQRNEDGATGRVPYNSSFHEIETHVSEISKRQVDGLKTTVLIAAVGLTVILSIVGYNQFWGL